MVIQMIQELIIVFLLCSTVFFLGISRLRTLIRLFAVQSLFLGLIPILIHPSFSIRLTSLSLLTVLFKTLIFPFLLLRTIKKIKINCEVEPYVNYLYSLFFGFLYLILSMSLSSMLNAETKLNFTLTTAFFMLFTGLFIIMSRKKAITQILGYLVFENGIFLLGFVLVPEIPLLIEISVLLDVFVAVFIMNVIIYNIDKEFAHIDIDKLNHLKG